MTKATFTLRLPPVLKAEAARLAKPEGVWHNQWIVAAVTEKIAEAQAVAAISGTRS